MKQSRSVIKKKNSAMKKENIIGVDLGGTNIRAGRIFNERIEKIYSQKITSNAEEKIVVGEVIESIRQVFDREVTAIGVGVPSVVDPVTGVVYDVQNIPSWKEVNLTNILANEFHVPIKINNDANCFVLGEKYFGKGKDVRNIVGLVIGTGMGAGLILDNKLYNGENTGAGEFGMIPYKNHNLEYYCSGQFFKNEYSFSGEEVSLLAKEGNDLGLKIFEQFGKNLGEALQIIVYAVDPAKIIIGGSVSKSFNYFIDSVLKTFEKFPYKKTSEKLKIEKSEKENITIFGAAALHFNN